MRGVLSITRADLDKPARSPIELLPSETIVKLPKIIGLHGTNGATAEKIFSSGAFDTDGLNEAAAKLHGIADRFYFYVASGRGFEFARDWDRRVSAGEIRRSVLGAANAVYWYSRFSLKGWLEHAGKEPEPSLAHSGLGVVLFEFSPSAFRKLHDDETIELKGDPVRGPFPKYLESGDFGSTRVRRLGAVVTDPELSEMLRLIGPERMLEGLDEYMEYKKRQAEKPEFEREIVRDRMFEMLERLGKAFGEKISDILAGRAP